MKGKHAPHIKYPTYQSCLKALRLRAGISFPFTSHTARHTFLQSEERAAVEVEVYVNGLLKGYAPLYPLSIIIALSYQLDSAEAHLFRKHICRELQRSAPVMEQIYLHGNGSIN